MRTLIAFLMAFPLYFVFISEELYLFMIPTMVLQVLAGINVKIFR